MLGWNQSLWLSLNGDVDPLPRWSTWTSHKSKYTKVKGESWHHCALPHIPTFSIHVAAATTRGPQLPQSTALRSLAEQLTPAWPTGLVTNAALLRGEKNKTKKKAVQMNTNQSERHETWEPGERGTEKTSLRHYLSTRVAEPPKWCLPCGKRTHFSNQC